MFGVVPDQINVGQKSRVFRCQVVPLWLLVRTVVQLWLVWPQSSCFAVVLARFSWHAYAHYRAFLSLSGGGSQMFIWSALAVRTLMASPAGTVAGPTSFSGHQHDAMGTSDALDQRRT